MLVIVEGDMPRQIVDVQRRESLGVRVQQKRGQGVC